MDPKLQQLTAYVQQQKQSGRTDDIIQDELERQGWSQQMLDAAFEQVYLVQMNYQEPAAPRKASKAKRIIIVVLCLLALAAILIYIVLQLGGAKNNTNQNQEGAGPNVSGSSEADSKTPTGNSNLGSALSRSSDNVRRKNDASNVASLVAEFMNNNQGSFPQTLSKGEDSHALLLCAAACDEATESKTTLDFYLASNVLLKDYSIGIGAPTIDQMFIVRDADCNEKQTALVRTTSSRSVAILFNTKTSSDGAELACQTM